MKEPKAAIQGPARLPFLAIWYPSRHVTTEAASRDVSNMEVVIRIHGAVIEAASMITADSAGSLKVMGRSNEMERRSKPGRTPTKCP